MRNFSCSRSSSCGDSNMIRRGLWRTAQNLLRKPATSEQNFCNFYPIGKARPKSIKQRHANVSSYARSLMSVHRNAQTHGPKHSHGTLRPSCRRKGQTLAGSGILLAISRRTHPAGVARRIQYISSDNVEQPWSSAGVADLRFAQLTPVQAKESYLASRTTRSLASRPILS